MKKKSLVGKTLLTKYGEEVIVLRRRKSRTFPFFPTFYLYDVSYRAAVVSIRCKEIDNLINGNPITIVFD